MQTSSAVAPASDSNPSAALPPASPRIRRIQRTALVLLLLAGVVNYLDRSTLAIANPLIRKDLGLSIEEMGLLLSAFLWAYAFAQLPVGAMVDRLGARVMLSISLAVWSVAQAFGGLVNNFTQFFIARMVLGIGEAPQFPTGAKVSRDWFAKKERGTATGIWNSSSTLGTALSAPILTILMLSFGWRWMFIIMGIAGLVVALGFYLIHRDPRHIDLTQEEKEHLYDVDGATMVQPTLSEWGRLFKFGTTWGMLMGFFGIIYVLWLYNAWLPSYLQMELHVTIAQTGWIAAVPYVFGVVGSLMGGKICDVLVGKGVSAINSRKYPMAISLLGTAFFTILTSMTHNTALAITFISISMLLIYVATSAGWAMASVAAPANCTASLGAMQNFGGYFGGALAPLITGIIVQRSATHSFQPALFVGAGIAVVAVIGYWTLVRKPIPAPEAAS